MKTFINKDTEIAFEMPSEIEGEELIVKTMGFADLAKISLNSPPEGGWTTDEMRIRIKITSKFENAEKNSKIDLEDAEFDKVLQCSNIKWNFMHKDIVAYDDHLLELKTMK